MRTLILSLALAASPALAGTPKQAAADYLEKARTVAAALDEVTPDATLIADTITALLEDAKPVVAEYGVLHAQCAEQLAALIALYPDIDTWSPSRIRRDVEVGQALPQAQGCYPARDVVAHPAIVRAYARSGITPDLRARVKRELDEAIEHMEEIAAELE